MNMRTLKTVAWTLLTLAGIAGLASFAAPNGDSVPVGTIMAWAGEKGSVPADWMICDGKALKTAQYKELFAAVGWSWGKPTAKKFNLPDLRGRFMRGVDDGTGLDPDADDREAAAKGGNAKGVGSVQDDSMQEHAHSQSAHNHTYIYPPYYKYLPISLFTSSGRAVLQSTQVSKLTMSASPAISGAINYKNHAAVKLSDETRPKNANVYFIIKVR